MNSNLESHITRADVTESAARLGLLTKERRASGRRGALMSLTGRDLYGARVEVRIEGQETQGVRRSTLSLIQRIRPAIMMVEHKKRAPKATVVKVITEAPRQESTPEAAIETAIIPINLPESEMASLSSTGARPLCEETPSCPAEKHGDAVCVPTAEDATDLETVAYVNPIDQLIANELAMLETLNVQLAEVGGGG